MRIRKAPRKGSQQFTIALTPHERLIWKVVHQLISSSDKEIVGQLYVQHVMKPLLGSNYVDAGVCDMSLFLHLHCSCCYILFLCQPDLIGCLKVAVFIIISDTH